MGLISRRPVLRQSRRNAISVLRKETDFVLFKNCSDWASTYLKGMNGFIVNSLLIRVVANHNCWLTCGSFRWLSRPDFIKPVTFCCFACDTRPHISSIHLPSPFPSHSNAQPKNYISIIKNYAAQSTSTSAELCATHTHTLFSHPTTSQWPTVVKNHMIHICQLEVLLAPPVLHLSKATKEQQRCKQWVLFLLSPWIFHHVDTCRRDLRFIGTSAHVEQYERSYHRQSAWHQVGTSTRSQAMS